MKIPLSAYAIYSDTELMNYLENGLISFEGATEGDLVGFVRKIMENTISLEEHEKMLENAHDDGYNQGFYEGTLED